MDKILGQEIKSLKGRMEYLEANCHGIEEKGYMKQFTPEQIAEFKDKLAGTSIAINEIEIRKKAAMDAFKLELQPLETERKDLLKGIKEKAEFVEEQCFKFIFDDERMVGYYNAEGVLIEARPMRPEEMQTAMFVPIQRTGTND
jgi:hypothetical protein